MGLDTTHNAWHGGYSAFMQWRTKIAQIAGYPPLRQMQGFGGYMGEPEGIIDWDSMTNKPLNYLLSHSDCDGHIPPVMCGKIADELEKLLPLLKSEPDQMGHIGNWVDKTKQFIEGLRLANTEKENLEFH